MKYCPNCGAKLTDEAIFCRKCGKRLSVQKINTEGSGQHANSGVRRYNTHTIALSIIICILFVGCVIVGVLLFADIKKKKVEEQLSTAKQYLSEEDYQKAEETYKAITSTSPKNTEAYKGLGNVYINLADQTQDEKESIKLRKEAVNAYEKVLEYDSHNKEIRNEIIIQYNIILVYLNEHEEKEEAKEIAQKLEMHKNAEEVTSSEEIQKEKTEDNSKTTSTKEIQTENQESDKPINNLGLSEEEVRTIYVEFFNSYYASAGILNDQERKEGILTSSVYTTSEAEWYVCSGVIGMDLADLDNDGISEMIAYYLDTKTVTINDVQRKASFIYADIFAIKESKEVERVVSAQLSENTLGTNTSVEKVGVIELNGKEYLYHYEYLNGIFGNGTAGYYVLYTIENGQFRCAYILGQNGIGSTDLQFVVQTYTDADKYTTVCCARDQSADSNPWEDLPLSSDYIIFDYENRYDCDQVCWKQLGLEENAPRDSISNGADYWNTDLVRGGCAYIITSSNIEYGSDGQTAYMYSEIKNRTEYRMNADPQPSDKPETKKETQETEANADKEEKKEESTAGTTAADNQKTQSSTAFEEVLNELTQQYGEMSIYTDEDAITSVNGVCYADLIDFNKDGTSELVVLCKKKDESDYTGYIYAIRDGNAKCIFSSNELTSGPSLYEEFVIANTTEHGYVIISNKGDDVDAINKIYGFDKEGKEFGLLRDSELVGEQGSNGWSMEYSINGELIAKSDGISVDLSQRKEQETLEWLGNYAIGPSFTISYWRDETYVSKDYLENAIQSTKEFIGNANAYEALEKLRKHYFDQGGCVYYQVIDGNVIHADVYTVGVGNLSRVCWVDAEIDTGKIIESDSDGNKAEYYY